MNHRLAWLTSVALLLGVPAVASADAPRALIRQGNEHYAAGRFAEALKCYQQAEAGTQPSAELLHDLAAAHFKLGQIDEARDLWVRAKAAPDAAAEARSRYNLGNCAYAEALTLAGQNGQQALAKLAEAAEQYQAAVRLDPTLTNARANLELTQLLKRQIEEQQQNQPQSQPSTSPSQDQQNEQQQPSTQPSQSDEKQQSKQDKQQKQDQSAATQPSEQSEEDQQQDQEPQKPPDEQQSPESQPSAMPETMPAESQPAERDQSGEESTMIHLTREQAERLLQMIRDAEKARREKLAAERMAKQQPVTRDW